MRDAEALQADTAWNRKETRGSAPIFDFDLLTGFLYSKNSRESDH